MKKDSIIIVIATLLFFALLFITWAEIAVSSWIVGHSGVEDLMQQDGKPMLSFIKDSFFTWVQGFYWRSLQLEAFSCGFYGEDSFDSFPSSHSAHMSHETHTDESQGRTSGGCWLWLAFLLGIYFIPFVVIIIDERFLKTYWFSRHLPGEMGEILRAIYPFHRLFN